MMTGQGDGGVLQGQAVYSPLVLALYDIWVLGLSNHVLWRCPTRHLRALYDRDISGNHLDVGVGTGYYLDHAQWPVPDPAITLLDLNANSLRAASRRIERYAPKAVEADAMQPLPLAGRFTSASLCFLLHCLPGTFPQKAIVFDHVRAVMADRARIFGATIVQGHAPRSTAAQKLMDIYNAKGVFSNSGDCVEDLEAELCRRFSDVRVELIGCVAVFEARVAA